MDGNRRKKMKKMFWGLWMLAAPVASAPPPAPPGLTVVPPFDGEVNLVWTPEPTATVWEVFRSLAGTPTPVVTPTPMATVAAGAFAAIRDVFVTNGREYLYGIRGLNGDGAGPFAPVTAAPFRAPAAIATVGVQAVRRNALDVSWSPPTSSYPISAYEIYRYAIIPTPTPTPAAPTATFTPTPTGTWVAPTPTFTVTPPPAVPIETVLAFSPTPIATVGAALFVDENAGGLGAFGIFYAVRAVDQKGNFGSFPAFSSPGVLPKSLLLPTSPQVSANVQEGLGFGPVLFWTGHLGVEEVSSYEIRRNATPIATVFATPSVTHTFQDAGAAFSSFPVTYSVAAKNPVGQGTPASVSVSFYGPAAPLSVRVTPDPSGAVTLAWALGGEGVYGLSAYQVFRGLSGVPPAAVTSPGPGTPTFTPTPTPLAVFPVTPTATRTFVFTESLANANGWTYWVEPLDRLNRAGGAGAPAQAPLTLAPTPPSAPTAVLTPVNNRVALSWTDAGNAFYPPKQRYWIYRKVEPTQTPQVAATVPYPTAVWNDVVPGGSGTPVVYFVAVEDAQANLSHLSAPSVPVTLSGATVPGKPQTSGRTSDGASLTFFWKLAPTPDAVERYEVYGPDFPTFTVTPTPLAVITPTPTQMAYTVSPLSPWEAALRYLVAWNTQGPSEAATLSGVVSGSVSLTAQITPQSREVEVRWQATVSAVSTPPLDHWTVHRSLSPAAGFTPVATVNLATFQWTDTAAQAGVTQYYRVTTGAENQAESPLFPTATPIPEASVLTWPEKPKGFSAKAGIVQTLLRWLSADAGQQVTAYEIQKEGTPIATVAPSPTMEWLATETPGVQSAYALIAQNAAGASDAAGPVTVLSAPQVTPLAVFTPPAGATPTPSVVWVTNLSYTGDVASYRVERSLDPTFTVSPSPVATAAAPVTWAGVSESGGEVVYYRVVAQSAEGVSANPEVSAVLPVTLWPSLPQSIVLSGDDTAVTLSWQAPSGSTVVTRYNVYRDVVSGGVKPLWTVVPEPTRETVDAALTPGEITYYQISAQGPGGEGALSSEKAFLAAPAPMLFATPAAGAATLVWVQSAPPPTTKQTGFVVLRRVEPTPQMTPLAFLLNSLTPTPYRDQPLASGQTYVYQVAPAASTSVWGPLSNSVTVVGAPPEPQLTVVAGDGLVQARWTFQSTALTYTLERKLANAGDTAFQVVAQGVKGGDYTDTGLLNKNFYAYRLWAVEAGGLSTVSKTRIALPARPPVVTNETVTASPGDGGVTLTWSAANPPGTFDAQNMYPLAGYRIFRSEDGGATYTEIAQVGPNVLQYVDPVSVLGGPARKYLIRAFDTAPDDGQTHETAYQPVVVQPLSAKTALDRNSIRPNQGAGADRVRIRFIVTRAGEVTIRVYTPSGLFVRELLRGNFSTGIHWTEWDGRDARGRLAASGVYLIMTKMPNHQEVSKVAVIK